MPKLIDIELNQRLRNMSRAEQGQYFTNSRRFHDKQNKIKILDRLRAKLDARDVDTKET